MMMPGVGLIVARRCDAHVQQAEADNWVRRNVRAVLRIDEITLGPLWGGATPAGRGLNRRRSGLSYCRSGLVSHLDLDPFGGHRRGMRNVILVAEHQLQ